MTESNVGSGSNPRRRSPRENPSLTSTMVLRAWLRLPRCMASAFSAEIVTCARAASIRTGVLAM
jgi:hypothetical protein